ncbi:dentin sialophosphoprotein isoform X1 [Spatholobus suberectus]|nr:dentin sialophosphoprotein isoform X1 [Spatholobus suberectus]
MILKTLMEEKQLDFNQPLLSVRRISSTVASENDNKSKPDKSLPKLPPLPFYKSELKSGPVSNPGTVPFVWEKTPGRPKNEGKLQMLAVERPSVAPKLPPGRVLKVERQDSDKVPKGASVTQSKTGIGVSDSQRVASLDNKVTKHESLKEVIEEKASSGSDDGDETYLDALDTLSRTESFFMSCSVSGLSEWDDQEVQPSGDFQQINRLGIL